MSSPADPFQQLSVHGCTYSIHVVGTDWNLLTTVIFLIFSSWTLKLDYFLPNLITKKFQYQFSCLNVSFFILEKVNKLELILSEFISRIFWNKKCKFVFQFVFVLIIRRFLVCVRKFLFFRALCFAFSLSVMCKIMEEPLEVNEWFEM